MATNYSANQYQSAFNSCNLQNWSVTKCCRPRPSLHDGYTQFVANDQGHLLPDAPRSKENPWGSFVGTWDMPRRIPPAKLNRTSRSAEASKHLTNWMEDSSFIDACNGLRSSITGQFDGELDSRKHSRCSKQEERVVNATQCTSPEPSRAQNLKSQATSQALRVTRHQLPHPTSTLPLTQPLNAQF
uniref:Protein Flattop n=1 Tax=Leptobrachium leishanense TaxID=445787 RepID=A0A8C5LT49_9ANUR